MTDRLEALKASAQRLSSLVGGLSPDQLTMQSYASKWTIADVLSHIGSGAVIMRNGVDTAVSERPPDPAFNQSVWDEWNA
ncbi:MAG TPA: maleylpyruvate isomerase N-terminal domain-containing protein, partial [Ilumatobacteraceae bacterium]|nr:maleylpyruvate isomerase N-terminal domain-containing protein [Ilumatobacteraceae bacterium]